MYTHVQSSMEKDVKDFYEEYCRSEFFSFPRLVTLLFTHL